MARKTREQFIEEARMIHGDKYDYSEVEYVNNKTKVKLICREHGGFWQTPCKHLCGQQCRSCGIEQHVKTKRHTIDQFIKNSKEIHGDKYDYSKVKYVNTDTKVEIICKIHSSFWQSPYKHIKRKQGCKKCGIIQRSNIRRMSVKEFIHRVKKIHGDKYDYSKVKYIDTHTKVEIICPDHGIFWQKAGDHLGKNGCKKCGNRRASQKRVKFNTKSFISEAQKIHGDKYDYSKVVYVNLIDKIIIICKEHGSFDQPPGNHLAGHGCSECAGVAPLNTQKFIERAKMIHGDRYDYSKTNYINMKNKVIIICKEHGEFEQDPYVHLTGSNCRKCMGAIDSTKEFVEKAKKIHGDKYDYSKSQYIRIRDKIEIICPKHGSFWQVVESHLNGHDCKLCSCSSCSKKSQEWLDSFNEDIDREYNIIIENQRYVVDGYHMESNTIYEFFGDFWHGNPEVYDMEKHNPVTKKKFGDLYQNVVNRVNIIKNAGYNLVYIWEHDYNNGHK